MRDKRISLRFRTDNVQDMRAWELLEKASHDRNASKNAIAIELILQALEHKDSNDALAEQIAELVAVKLSGATTAGGATGAPHIVNAKDNEQKGDVEIRADEPEVLGEDAIDFLDMFG
jgi:ribosomal protein L12E/L44/L45/RPP1/RPP2